MNKKAKQVAYIMAMCGAGLVMIGYALASKANSFGTPILVIGCVMLAVCIGFFLSDRKYKYCPKCGLKVTDKYIRKNARHFGKYKCPKCASRQIPVEKPANK